MKYTWRLYIILLYMYICMYDYVHTVREQKKCPLWHACSTVDLGKRARLAEIQTLVFAIALRFP